jgi:hypothetical protein
MNVREYRYEFSSCYGCFDGDCGCNDSCDCNDDSDDDDCVIDCNGDSNGDCVADCNDDCVDDGGANNNCINIDSEDVEESSMEVCIKEDSSTSIVTAFIPWISLI